MLSYNSQSSAKVPPLDLQKIQSLRVGQNTKLPGKAVNTVKNSTFHRNPGISPSGSKTIGLNKSKDRLKCQIQSINKLVRQNSAAKVQSNDQENFNTQNSPPTQEVEVKDQKIKIEEKQTERVKKPSIFDQLSEKVMGKLAQIKNYKQNIIKSVDEFNTDFPDTLDSIPNDTDFQQLSQSLIEQLKTCLRRESKTLEYLAAIDYNQSSNFTDNMPSRIKNKIQDVISNVQTQLLDAKRMNRMENSKFGEAQMVGLAQTLILNNDKSQILNGDQNLSRLLESRQNISGLLTQNYDDPTPRFDHGTSSKKQRKMLFELSESKDDDIQDNSQIMNRMHELQQELQSQITVNQRLHEQSMMEMSVTIGAQDSLANVKADLQAQIEELTLDLHLKDKQVIHLTQVNNKFNETLMECDQDVTILGHLKTILSDTHYHKIKDYLKTDEAKFENDQFDQELEQMFTFGTDESSINNQTHKKSSYNTNTAGKDEFIKVIEEPCYFPPNSTKNCKPKVTLLIPDSTTNSCFNFEEDGLKTNDQQSMLFTANNSTCEYLHQNLKSPSNILVKTAASPSGPRPLFNFTSKLQSTQQQQQLDYQKQQVDLMQKLLSTQESQKDGQFETLRSENNKLQSMLVNIGSQLCPENSQMSTDLDQLQRTILQKARYLSDQQTLLKEREHNLREKCTKFKKLKESYQSSEQIQEGWAKKLQISKSQLTKEWERIDTLSQDVKNKESHFEAQWKALEIERQQLKELRIDLNRREQEILGQEQRLAEWQDELENKENKLNDESRRVEDFSSKVVKMEKTLKYESQRIENWDNEIQQKNEELTRQQNFVISERDFIEKQRSQIATQRNLSNMYIPEDLKKMIQFNRNQKIEKPLQSRSPPVLTSSSQKAVQITNESTSRQHKSTNRNGLPPTASSFFQTNQHEYVKPKLMDISSDESETAIEHSPTGVRKIRNNTKFFQSSTAVTPTTNMTCFFRNKCCDKGKPCDVHQRRENQKSNKDEKLNLIGSGTKRETNEEAVSQSQQSSFSLQQINRNLKQSTTKRGDFSDKRELESPSYNTNQDEKHCNESMIEKPHNFNYIDGEASFMSMASPRPHQEEDVFLKSACDSFSSQP